MNPVNAGQPLHASNYDLVDNPGCKEVCNHFAWFRFYFVQLFFSLLFVAIVAELCYRLMQVNSLNSTACWKIVLFLEYRENMDDVLKGVSDWMVLFRRSFRVIWLRLISCVRI